jgi:hypothetical protein
MTNQRVLKVGDIVSINSGRRVIVVRSERKEDYPRDGCPYVVDEFDTIEMSGTPKTASDYGRAGVTTDPKVTSYYLHGGSMGGKGKMVKPSDVEVVGTVGLKITPTVTYDWKIKKLYD